MIAWKVAAWWILLFKASHPNQLFCLQGAGAGGDNDRMDALAAGRVTAQQGDDRQADSSSY